MWKSRADKVPPAQFYSDLFQQVRILYPEATIDERFARQMRDIWIAEWRNYAETEEELQRSARYFAEALAKGGLTTLEAIVTHRVFHGAAKKIRERWPTPDWLRSRYVEQESKRSRPSPKEEASRRRQAIGETLSSGAAAVIVPAGQGAGDAISGLVIGGIAVAATLGVVTAGLLLRKGGH